jgi:2-dehydropantoate 2-reductase
MTGRRIAILGAGANGAGVGADLVQAGLDVTFIDQWPEHVAAIRASGIRVNLPDSSVRTAATAYNLCDVATLRAPFDIVFVLVKAYDTRWACELVEPLIHPAGLVVGLQNGMSHEVIADVVGVHRTLGAVIEVSSSMWEPGVVNRQSDRAASWFAIGSLDESTQGREREVADLLRHAGTVEVSDDIRSSKWMKLVANAAELVPSAILGLPLADAVRAPGMREFMVETGREAMRAAVATGHTPRPIFGMAAEDLLDPDRIPEVLLDRVLSHYTAADTQTTVLQDWLKGRRAEVREINGRVVYEHNRLGESAPCNEAVMDLALRIESGELSPALSNCDLLLAGFRR